MSTSVSLVFEQRMTIGLRWVLAAVGLFCFYPTYDLLIRPGVPVLQIGMLPMWIVALGAMALGLVFLVAAVLGISRTVILDPAASEVRELGVASFGIRFSRRYAFRDLGKPTVVRDDSSDGPPSYRVVVPCAGRKRPLEIESYADEAAAQQTAARVARVISAARA